MITTLSGTLERHDDGWRWNDGTPEPRVRDLDPSAHYNFRVRATSGAKFVEVPRQLALEETDLEWVSDWWKRGELKDGLCGDTTPRAALQEALGMRGKKVILVPLDAWDAWASFTTIGAEWDQADEEAILARARELSGD